MATPVKNSITVYAPTETLDTSPSISLEMAPKFWDRQGVEQDFHELSQPSGEPGEFASGEFPGLAGGGFSNHSWQPSLPLSRRRAVSAGCSRKRNEGIIEVPGGWREGRLFFLERKNQKTFFDICWWISLRGLTDALLCEFAFRDTTLANVRGSLFK